MKKIFPLLTVLALAGCSPSQTTPAVAKGDEMGCSGETSIKLIKKLLADEVTQQVNGESASTGLQKADAAKVRAVVSAIRWEIEDVRTTSKDPNSTKKFCEANLKVVVPDNFVSEANEMAQKSGYKSVAEMANAASLEFSANQFQEVIEYDVQPTDRMDKVYGSLRKAAVAPGFLAYITYFASLKAVASGGLSIAGGKKQDAAVAPANQEPAIVASAAPASEPAPVTAPAPVTNDTPSSRFADIKGKTAHIPMGSELNARSGPSAEFPIVVQIYRGATVRFLGDVATRAEKSGVQAVWANVELVSGKLCLPEHLDPKLGCTLWQDARPLSGWVNATKLEF